MSDDAVRWVCLLLPRLSLEGALRRRVDPEAPFALTEGAAPRRIIRAANATARAAGVRPGQALSLAESLCQGLDPRLETMPLDDDLTRRWRRRLAAWAYGYSGQVSLHYPHALVFEVASSFALFGPWPRLETQLRQDLAALGFSHRLVIAPNPAAARVLVNVHDGLAVDDETLTTALGELPLTHAGLERDSLRTLERSGFRHLGELFALPRSALARRFGKPLMRHLGELRGEWALALEYHRPASRFSRTFTFDRPVQAVAGLAFPLKRLLQELGFYLRGRDVGVERFQLKLTLEDRPAQTLDIGLQSVARDAETLLELTRAHLERVRLAGPVMAVTLKTATLAAYAPARRELLSGPLRQSQAWHELQQRLMARLGEETLKSLVEYQEHRPEAAVLAGRGALVADTDTVESRRRPGWLVARPERCDAEIIRLLSGPERIESGWWDGDDVRRDYYLAEWHDGRRAWVWQQAGQAGWYLHGWFG
ncbi:Y-family DNA polymerase [Salinicola avicenniae]|uniref:Y-family DNA polymerase n=1 Tax=Salinicola avicenniae TaxID=2916836 RepID=UPI0020733D0A|nr:MULTISPECIES: DNA polymerase Y family protein [unclassified Salinicola]